MFAPKYIGVLAVLSALASVDATGICYSPWHHGTVDEEVVQKDFGQIKQYFDSVRTYHAKFGGPYGGVNVIDAAAKAGIKVSVGIMMGDGEQDEIQNVCEGAQRHPEAVDSIMVGNENLQNGGWGSCSTQKLIETIEKVKACVAGKGIKVGTSQRINEWLTADGRKELAGHCDIVGVNIYPFFTPGHDEPIEKFKKQWEQVNQEVPGGKVVVTETGWPRQGETEGDNVPSQQTTQKYFNDFNQWCKEQGKPNYFFMMYDTTQSYTGKQYEKSFGVADSNGNLQIQIPEQGGGGYEQQTEPPAQDGGEQQTEPPAQDGGEQQTEPPAQDGGEQQTEPPAQGGGEQQQEPPAQDGGDYGQVQPPADQTPVEEQTADQAPVEPVPEQQTPEQQTPEQQTPVVTPAPVHDNDKLCV